MTLKFHLDRGGSHEGMIAVNCGAELLRTLAFRRCGMSNTPDTPGDHLKMFLPSSRLV